MKKYKGYVVGNNNDNDVWFLEHLFDNIDLVTSYEEGDFIILTGGPDVDPKRYGHPKLKGTYVDLERDEETFSFIDKAVEDSKPILAFCYGAQACAVHAGHELIQHMNDNHNIHPVKVDHEVRTIQMTSSHHQGIYLSEKGSNYYLLGVTLNHSYNAFMGDGQHFKNYTCNEIVYFSSNQSLCIQGHPAWMYLNKDIYKDTFIVLKDYITNYIFRNIDYNNEIEQVKAKEFYQPYNSIEPKPIVHNSITTDYYFYKELGTSNLNDINTKVEEIKLTDKVQVENPLTSNECIDLNVHKIAESFADKELNSIEILKYFYDTLPAYESNKKFFNMDSIAMKYYTTKDNIFINSNQN